MQKKVRHAARKIWEGYLTGIGVGLGALTVGALTSLGIWAIVKRWFG